MAMAVVFIRSEVLCFTLNKYGKCLSKNLKVIISDFYSDDEIWSAKELLHSELSKVAQVDLPRLIGRKGDNRVKLNVDDIFTLIARADELNSLSKLPTFVAADPDMLPNMNPEALDVCILAKKLASLEQTVMRHEAQFGACTGMMSTISVVSDTDGGTSGDKHGGGNVAGAPADDQSWASLVRSLDTKDGEAGHKQKENSSASTSTYAYSWLQGHIRCRRRQGQSYFSSSSSGSICGATAQRHYGRGTLRLPCRCRYS